MSSSIDARRIRKESHGYVSYAAGCITYGETVDECTVNAKEAIELYMESLEADGVTVPAF